MKRKKKIKAALNVIFAAGIIGTFIAVGAIEGGQIEPFQGFVLAMIAEGAAFAAQEAKENIEM